MSGWPASIDPPARATPATAWPPPRVLRALCAASPAARPCRQPRPPVASAATPPSSALLRRPPPRAPTTTATPHPSPTAAHPAWAGPRIPSDPANADRRLAPPERAGRASTCARSTGPGRGWDGQSVSFRRDQPARTTEGREKACRAYLDAEWPSNRGLLPYRPFCRASKPGVGIALLAMGEGSTMGEEMP